MRPPPNRPPGPDRRDESEGQDHASFPTWVSDFSINQRLALKMDLPSGRESVLGFFDRLRKEFPRLNRFHRMGGSGGGGPDGGRAGGSWSGEFVLESNPEDEQPMWASMRRLSVRSGVLNPATTADAYRLHRLVVEAAPYYLSVSPLEVDFLEIAYGFDLAASGNHDAIVFDALYAQEGHPLSALLSAPGAAPTNVQPMFGITIGGDGREPIEVFFEVKTRQQRGPRSSGAAGGGPHEEGGVISVDITLRRAGGVNRVEDLLGVHAALTRAGEELIRTRVLQGLLMPIRQAIASASS